VLDGVFAQTGDGDITPAANAVILTGQPAG
jgi:hypothetical protein